MKKFNNGKANGVSKLFYESGQLKATCFFKNDTIVGQLKRFYKNGLVSEIENLENGKVNGKWTRFYESRRVHNLNSIRKDSLFDNTSNLIDSVFVESYYKGYSSGEPFDLRKGNPQKNRFDSIVREDVYIEIRKK